MWYLKSDLTPSMRIEEVWKLGYTGKGVVTTVIDDGLQHSHPDLAPNYDPKASANFVDMNYATGDYKTDPTPIPLAFYNNHGTRCAGVIASVADNGLCGVGIAYKAKIGGINL